MKNQNKKMYKVEKNLTLTGMMELAKPLLVKDCQKA